MMSSDLIEFKKIELDYRLKKNDNNIIIKNKTKNEMLLINEGLKYIILGSETISFNFSDKNFNLKILKNQYETLDEINIQFYNYKINGIGGESQIESPYGKIKIKNLNYDDIIYDSSLNKLFVKCIIIFKIDSNQDIYPIEVKKSLCGLNLPINNFIFSINKNLKVKNTIIKGRQLLLNRKALKIDIEGEIKYYNILSYPNNSFFVEGFLLNSYQPSNLLN